MGAWKIKLPHKMKGVLIMIKRIVTMFFLCWSLTVSCMEQNLESYLDSFDITVKGKKGKEAWAYIKKFLETTHYCTPLETIEDQLVFNEFMGNLKVTPKNTSAASCMAQDGKSFLDSFDIAIPGEKDEEVRDYLERFLESAEETAEDQKDFDERMADLKVTSKSIPKNKNMPKLSKSKKRRLRRKRAKARRLKQN